MKARINNTGTHLKNGFLKIRVDLYPDPADKTYSLHLVNKFDREPTTEELADPDGIGAMVPVRQELNPCLCHFIEVPEDVTREQLLAHAAQLFTPDCLATLDDALMRPDAAHRVSPYTRSRPRMAALRQVQGKMVRAADTAALIAAVNARLSGMELADRGGGKIEDIKPQSIDVGPGATDRASSGGAAKTIFDLANPANASGTLDTWELWYNTNATGVEVATASNSGAYFTTRDTETIGNVTTGSKQTFTGLSTNVVTGDFVGVYSTTGNLEKDTTGGSGFYYISGDYIPCTNVLFTKADDQAISVYATGGTIVAPTVTTQAATNVKSTTLTGNGNITNTGGENCTSRGIQYGYATGNYPYSVSENGSFGAGAFTENLTGLTEGATVYMRSFATNSAGTSYSSEVNATLSYSTFNSSFKTASFADWDSTTQSGANATQSTDWASDGTHSLKVSGIGAVGDAAYVTHNIGTVPSEFWAVEDLYLPSIPAFGQNQYINCICPDVYAYIGGIYDVYASKFGVQWKSGPGGSDFTNSWQSGTYTIQANTKYTIQIHLKIHASAGIIQLWVNDTLVIDLSSLNTSNISVANIFSGQGYNDFAISPDYNMYFDNFKYSESGYIQPGTGDKTASESGQGTEAAGAVVASVTGAETGSGVDGAAALTASIPASENSSGVDGAAVVGANILASESGSGLENATTSAPSNFTASDSGSGVESPASATALIFVSEAGAGAEGAPTATANILASESGSGLEGPATAAVNFFGNDGGAGVDVNAGVAAALSRNEAGAAVESLGSRDFSAVETAAGTEGAPAKTASLIAGDAGQAAEYAQIPGLLETLFGQDSGGGDDDLKVLVVTSGQETRLRADKVRVGLPHKEVKL